MAHDQDSNFSAAYSPPTADVSVAPSEDEEAALGRSGANALLAVAILEFISVTVQLFVLSTLPTEPFVMLFAYGLIAVFLGLYVWARGNPYPACVAGLAVYILIILLSGLADPATLTQGLLVKLVVIFVLASAIRNIRNWRAVRGAA